jgi:histidinol-phosphate aminotransferase
LSETLRKLDLAEKMARPSILNLEPYIPGKPAEEVQRELGLGEVVKMASNENPWGASPLALEAVMKELPRVYQYPEGSCRDLRRALANHFEISEDMVTVSNGADNVLMMITQAFVDPGAEVVMARPTFPVYRTATVLMGGVPVEVPLEDFTHDLGGMGGAISPRTKVVVVCNPNSPTGTSVGQEEMQAFLARLPEGMVLVVDEVYGEFASSSSFPDVLGFIRDGKPVLSVRSFSKLYGLAGLRVGYAMGPPGLIQVLNRVREPFPVNRLAVVAAQAALGDLAFRDHVLRETEKGRLWLMEAFEGMGLRCLPSHTNFVFVDLGTDAQVVFEKLLRRGIIIRPGGIWKTPTWCRITVGKPEQNENLIWALKQVLGPAA